MARLTDAGSNSSFPWMCDCGFCNRRMSSILSRATTDRGSSSKNIPAILIGKARIPKRAIALTSSPIDNDPSSTSQVPIMSRKITPMFGKAKIAGSKIARSFPTFILCVRIWSADSRMRWISCSLLPSDFTTMMPSKLS